MLNVNSVFTTQFVKENLPSPLCVLLTPSQILFDNYYEDFWALCSLSSIFVNMRILPYYFDLCISLEVHVDARKLQKGQRGREGRT